LAQVNLKQIDNIASMSNSIFSGRQKSKAMQELILSTGSLNDSSKKTLLGASHAKQVEIMTQLYEEQVIAASKKLENLTEPIASEMDKITSKEKRTLNESRSFIESYTEETLGVYNRYFNGIRGMSEEYSIVSIALLDAQMKKTKQEMALREVNLSQAAKEFNRKLLQAHREVELEKIKIKAAKRSESFTRGFGARMLEIRREMLTMGEQGYQLAISMESAFSNAFTDMATGAKTFKEAFNDMANSIFNDMMRIAANQLAASLMTSIGGSVLWAGLNSRGTVVTNDVVNTGRGIQAHSGGLVGVSSFPTRNVPLNTFSGAPRLHGGLNSDEFPAILQSGERVIKRGGGNNNQPPGNLKL